MKTVTRISILFVLLLTITMLFSTANADAGNGSGLLVTYEATKDSYEAGEPITVILTVTNQNSSPITGITLMNQIPEGFTLDPNSQDVNEVSKLSAGEEAQLISVYNPANLNTKLPDTGDHSSFTGMFVLFAISTLGLIVFGNRKDTIRRYLSMILCVVLLFGMFPASISIAETDSNELTLFTDDIKYDSKNITLMGCTIQNGSVSSSTPDADADHDGVVDFVEELFGTNPTLDDTDNDGLSDYIEIYKTDTHPKKVDTDNDGINDGDEDFDEDSLTNLEELALGTDLTRKDSDSDGLTDKEEIAFTNTDPQNPDSDGDGLLDGNEFLLGLNPNEPQSDGKTPDAQRLFNQELDESNISPALLKDNAFVPTLSGDVPDVIESHVLLESKTIDAFSDNRSIYGKTVHVETDYPSGSNLVLSFDCSSIADRIQYLKVFQFEDNSFVPCETEYSGSKISTRVTTGDYFIVDVEQLLVYLGIPVDQYKPAAAFSRRLLSAPVVKTQRSGSPKRSSSNDVPAQWYEENYTLLPQTRSIGDNPSANGVYVLNSVLNQPAMMELSRAATNSSVSGQADIVFVIDSTGSMSGAINNVVSNVNSFVTALTTNYDVRANFALIDYKDITCAGEETIIIKNGSSNWYSDANVFKNKIASLYVSGGGDGPETAIDALGAANSLNFRQSANKFIILVTDADYKTDNDYGLSSMSEITSILKKKEVVVSVISDTYYEPDYHELYTNTNGVFGNIYGNFSAVLLKLADRIGEVVNDGEWVLLNDYQYVKLDKSVTSDGYSSDSDGLSDSAELGTLVTEDLTPMIKFVLDANGVPMERYEGKTTITKYKNKSHPLLVDTDYDGIDDHKDSAPYNNNFKGKAYQYDDKGKLKFSYNVEFNVDYRLLFGNNKEYNDDLAVLASLYASDVYEDLYVSVTSGATGGSDDGKAFGRMFGLENPDLIKVQSDDGYDFDDQTEFFIGHREVEYKGETREIIVLSVRGTNGTNAEWSSNFDVGADTDAYYNMTGKHPDWKNKKNHKGFDVAYNRLLKEYDNYIESHGLADSSVPKSILITGHSRGAAIANLLGAYFEKRADYDSYTYTFAAPFSTTDSAHSSFSTIFNIVNSDDIIPYLPLYNWGFRKYGETIPVSVKEYYEVEGIYWGFGREGTFEWLIGQDYNNDGGTTDTLNAFYEIAKDRTDLYQIDRSDDGTVNIGNKYHATVKGVESRKIEVEQLLDKFKLRRFCEITIDYSWPYHVKVTYCPAYLMQNLSNMADDDDTTNIDAGFPMTGFDTKGKYADAKAEFIGSSGKIPLLSVIGGMEHPHMQATYYLIVHNHCQPLRGGGGSGGGGGGSH